MKKLFFILGLFPISGFAQSDLTQGNIMKMMEQAQKAQACMQGVDESAFESIEAEGKAMQADIKALCANGERDDAQDKAQAYAKELMGRPEMAKVRECSEMLRGILPEMPFDNFEEKYANSHVCDDI